jgi:hypothetical protein
MTARVYSQRGEESTIVGSAVRTQQTAEVNPKWYFQVRYSARDAHPISSKVPALVKIA